MPEAPAKLCTGLGACAAGLARTLVLDDFKTLFYSDAPWYDRSLAAVGVVGMSSSWPSWPSSGPRGALRDGRRARRGSARPWGSGPERPPCAPPTTLRRATCGHCFPAGTGVATPKGTTPSSGCRWATRCSRRTPRPEGGARGGAGGDRRRGQAADRARPLGRQHPAGDRNHAFWVDGGRTSTSAGWLQAGQLRPGDRLRTADGRGVTVRAVRWNAARRTSTPSPWPGTTPSSLVPHAC